MLKLGQKKRDEGMWNAKECGKAFAGSCVFVMYERCAGKDVKEPEGEFIIGVVTKSRNSEYWMSVNAGMEKAAKEMNVKTVILSPDTETDKKIQKKMIRDLLKMKVDALAVSPIDSNDNRDYYLQAQELGIPVYSYDTPIADVEVPYIGIDNEKVGYELAGALAEKNGV